METKHLKKYAPEARREFIEAVTNKAAVYGLLSDEILPMKEEGDVVIIGERPFPRSVVKQRKELEGRIKKEGFQQFLEAIAYTWFNRFVAIRYMELYGYLDHGYRVLSHPEGKSTPEILENAERIELPGLKRDEVVDLKLDGGKDEQLYQMLLLAQCNALHKAMPFLFESIKDGTELLLPDNLLHTGSLVRKLSNDIPEDQWRDVEIIGWMYQFYISERKEEVIGKAVKTEDVPAATQLFTPNWIVRYMLHNTLGRKWIATYPDSPLKQQMEFLIDPAEQLPEVEIRLREITPDSVNPEEITLLDPACGSGHILVEAYDLFKAIYQERGYRARDIPTLILTKNLFGLEIDNRAAQLAAFALMMKARQDDRSILASGVHPNVLAIVQTDDLTSGDIVAALNLNPEAAPPPPAGHLFESEDNLFTQAAIAAGKTHTTNVGSQIEQLIGLFTDARASGSLTLIPDEVAATLSYIEAKVQSAMSEGDDLFTSLAEQLIPVIQQARLLTTTYDCVVANPPYMGNKSLPSNLRSIAKERYKEGKSDLFAFFTQRISDFVSEGGALGLMTPFTWLTIKSYESFRLWLLDQYYMSSMIVPEYHAFFESAYVPVCAFTCFKNDFDHNGTFIDLGEFYGEEIQPTKALEAISLPDCKWKHFARKSEFQHVPGTPIAYSASHAILAAFRDGVPLHEYATPRVGMITGDNDTFLRLWQEIDYSRMGVGLESRESARESGLKWFPYQKGGPFRKWFGNQDYVVNWLDDGHDLRTTTNDKGKVPAHAFNDNYIFKPNVNWSKITSGAFSARICDEGHLFDDAGSGVFGENEKMLFLAGFLNSPVAGKMLRILNPTLNVQAWNVGTLPIVAVAYNGLSDVVNAVKRLRDIAKDDWDMQEVSWGFRCNALIEIESNTGRIEDAHSELTQEVQHRVEEAVALEKHLNTYFINAYGLQDELCSEVTSEGTALYQVEREEDINQLVSYAIGCMAGRYSLDEPGLVYAHSGNEGFDASKYSTFPADEDGIVPITETAWFPDDAANRFEQFIKTAWPEEHLEENLTFVAESLGKKKGETSRDCIRRYLATGFYKHHLSMYKKRPIYWLFSSGKQRAFQCLVYLHRYNAGTLSRMRTEYVVKLQGKINSRIDQLEDDIPAANSTSHRKKLEKERDKLIKQRDELLTFDEKLRHYADQRIELDLDDGVKVNYGNFGDLLAEVKSITGKKPKQA